MYLVRHMRSMASGLGLTFLDTKIFSLLVIIDINNLTSTKAQPLPQIGSMSTA